MKSDILVTLIKEVVKNEVKQQVKEELVKLIKSGAVTLNSQKKQTPSLAELTEVNTTAPIRKQTVVPTQQRVQQPQKEYTKNAAINEILNMTTPFTSAQRAEGAGAGGSVLDMLQPQMSEEDGWDTMDFRDIDVPQQNIPQQFESTGDKLQDATMKALTRNYADLVKRF
jgi:hypothetical protein